MRDTFAVFYINKSIQYYFNLELWTWKWTQFDKMNDLTRRGQNNTVNIWQTTFYNVFSQK